MVKALYLHRTVAVGFLSQKRLMLRLGGWQMTILKSRWEYKKRASVEDAPDY